MPLVKRIQFRLVGLIHGCRRVKVESVGIAIAQRKKAAAATSAS